VTVEIPLSTKGFVALVDDEDAPAVRAASGTWRASKDGRTVYVKRHVRKPNGRYTTQTLHQFLTGLELVDHANGDGLDNRRCNLRLATFSQNCANRRPRTDTATGFKGVSRLGNKWRARIQIDGRRTVLGSFATPEQAAAAYDAAALETFGVFARLNFPQTTTKETAQ
jgi:hypothetical protein